mmetsp:Transcript_31328/g.82376  ORF Transcript_31328/g.82376 Transcript_31328/m.82376 type:complete len:325 (+) Transcript_31328:723-1697(+)
MAKDKQAVVISPRVHRQAKLHIRVDRIHTLVLQPVGADLVGEPDAPALMPSDVQQDGTLLVVHHLQEPVQLPPVAALRCQDIAHKALRVHARRDGLRPVEVTLSHGSDFDLGVRRAEDVDPAFRLDLVEPHLALSLEAHGGMAVALAFGFLLGEPSQVVPELAGRQHRNAMRLSEARGIGGIQKRAVLAHGLRERGDRCQSCQPAEIQGGLRAPARLEDATRSCTEKENVPWRGERSWLGRRVAERQQRGRAVLGRCTRRDSRQKVHGRKGTAGPAASRGGRHVGRLEAEGLKPVIAQASLHEASGPPHKPRDLLWHGELCCQR